ncbi:hypothetical protein F7725_014213 [Dissostichus mawsoni]|uniref:IRF tryptophan pentad repeat domain-containing protein n=1 Tax=Dissostichus mawsoni TaxID=36200 RepID=A0A7J5YVI9_DISMA|nr:hypothetical protein F7725_014213 [Dissostichus mawsoni]
MSKPLLIPWLRTKINSGHYDGVQWTNPEQTEFSVPWKHALRQDSSDTDILIFKAWAESSGNGRAHGEPSVWKRNFRSALRAKGFTMISDNKNDGANPHKVFRWPEASASRANSAAGSQEQDDPDLLEDFPLPTQEVNDCGFVETQESQVIPNFKDYLYLPEDTVFSESPGHHDILQECLMGLNIGLDTGRLALLIISSSSSLQTEASPEQQQLQNPAVIGGHALPGQQQFPVMYEGEAGLPEQPAGPIEGAVGGAYDGQFAEQFKHSVNNTRDGEHFKTHFRISVYYRGVKVLEQLVDNEVGIRLVYRPQLTGIVLDPESGLSLVSLPSPGVMLDQTQANLTQRILDKLGEGLDVGVSGSVVYGQRRGEIKAFWSRSKFDESRQPQEISKLQPQPLYMFKEFLQDNRPWDRKLITVEVVLTSMEQLKNMAVEGGASSLQSVELQMSLEEMMDLY